MDWIPRFFRPCIFPVLRDLDYGVRPTINNGVAAGNPSATDLAVSLSMFDSDGRHLGTSGEIDRLSPGKIAKYDLDELLARPDVRSTVDAGSEGNQLGILHLVPAQLVGHEAADIPTRDLMGHVMSSDDFIEYFQRPKGVVTGVAYQTGPKNDPRFGSTMTTVVQAPKVIVSEPVDTLFSVMNIGTSFDYDKPVHLDFWVLRADGTRVARGLVEVPAWTFRLVSMTSFLEESGVLDEFREQGGMGMLLGYAKDGTLVPLSFTRNKESGAIACDHTLPPTFYVTTWGGEFRMRANAKLEEEFFASDAPAALAVR